MKRNISGTKVIKAHRHGISRVIGEEERNAPQEEQEETQNDKRDFYIEEKDVSIDVYGDIDGVYTSEIRIRGLEELAFPSYEDNTYGSFEEAVEVSLAKLGEYRSVVQRVLDGIDAIVDRMAEAFIEGGVELSKQELEKMKKDRMTALERVFSDAFLENDLNKKDKKERENGAG